MTPRHATAYRRDSLWLAAMVHRASGFLLACFLPLHFLVLGLAIRGADPLDAFLAITRTPVVEAAEAILVAMLAVHLLGGLRILAVEFLPWRNGQKRLAALSVLGAVVVGALYLIERV